MHKILSLLILLTLITPNETFAKRKTTKALDNFITKAIEEGQFPGAQVVVGNSDTILYSHCYGHKDWRGSSEVDQNTIYDLASVTKIFATTLSIMTLVEQGTLSIDSSIGSLLGLCDTLPQSSVTVRELLYHTSGFAPGLPIGVGLVKSASERVKMITRRPSATNPHHYDTTSYLAKELLYDTLYIKTSPSPTRIELTEGLYLEKSYHLKMDSMALAAYRAEKRGEHIYSDINFYLLQKIIERTTHTTLDQYSHSIHQRMGINSLGYHPREWCDIESICPTEYDFVVRRDTIRGRVHDELVALQGGVGGSAGLFGSAQSCAEICAMLLRGGVAYNGERILQRQTIDHFTEIVHSPLKGSKSVYGLGFTKIDNKERPYSPQSYGHSGYTGTYFWIDPTEDIYLIILTNRVHPTRTNKKFNPDTRAEVWSLMTKIFCSKK